MSTTYERRQYLFSEDSKLRWPAILAGFFAAVAVQLVLLAIGGALGVSGLTAIYSPRTIQGWGIAAGIWTVLSPLASLFIGGLVAGMLAHPAERRMAAFHSGMVWCLSLILGGAIVLFSAAPTLAGVAGGTRTGASAAVATKDTRTAKTDTVRPRNEVDHSSRVTPQDEKNAAKTGSAMAWGTVVAMLLGLGGAFLGGIAAHNTLYGQPAERTSERSLVAEDKETRRVVMPSSGLGSDYDRPELH